MQHRCVLSDFKQHAEQRRARTQYTYPPSPIEDEPSRQPSAAYRVKQLQAELAALEAELSQSPPDAQEEGDGPDLLTDLVDVRGRLEKLGKSKRNPKADGTPLNITSQPPDKVDSGAAAAPEASGPDKPTTKMGNVVEMDRRVGQLEELVGSSSAALDEVRKLSCVPVQTLTIDFFRLRPSRRLSCLCSPS
jgi:nuclear migration protein JNM1